MWRGSLTAILLRICQTLLKNHIHPRKGFVAYFESCAQNHGRPPEDIDVFLPWHLSVEQKNDWELPEPFT